MKTSILFFTTFVLLASCTKDSPTKAQLPPETQTGANTFGVTIKGKVYIPRDPTGGSGFDDSSGHGVILWGIENNSWQELEIVDGASAVGFQINIHMQPIAFVGKVILHQSNFHGRVDSTPFTNIFFEIWDSTINNYATYGSIENQGELNITKHSNGIISGNFKGKFARYHSPNDIIEITDGRFDINTITLSSHVFP